jgi:hypothetical protein
MMNARLADSNFIYVHLNRVIKKYDVDMFYVAGPGHGGPALVGNTHLEGSYSEVYPRLPRGGPTSRQRHQRQDHPSPGRRRALRRASRRGAQPRADTRLAGRRAPAAGRVAVAGRPAGPRLVGASGVVRAASGSCRAPRGRAARRLRNLQTLVEIAVDKNSTVVFPAPLMSTIQELGAFLNREANAAAPLAQLSTNGSASEPATGADVR